MYTDIIIPVDGSESSFRVLPIAASLAQGFGAEPHILAAWGDLSSAIMTTRIREAAQGDLSNLAESLILKRHDRPVADIIYQAVSSFAEPLLCMTTHGRGRSAAVLGSVVAETMEKLANPVVLVGPDCVAEPIPTSGHLLVCSDGTDFADSILPIVAHFATALGLTTEVITVLDPDDLDDARRSIGAADVNSAAEASHVGNVAKRLADATGGTSNFEVLHNADPAIAILEHAAGTSPSMIAMATHDEYRLKRMMTGSVTANVARRAVCPVLTFHPTES